VSDIRKREPIVAIDGPSGAGKSTVSRAVAEKLGFVYIDTGAMYRCVGLIALHEELACEESGPLEKLLADLDIRFVPGATQGVQCNGENVTKAIREHEVSKAASDFSALPSVRQRLVAMQREMGRAGGVVMEGRDIGTNVFPDAEVKVFLDARDQVRAMRRFEELKSKGTPVDFETILADQKRRDENDRSRELNPLTRAADAVVVDTSGLSIEMVVEAICNLVKKKR
jgi:CMP/dCMP kinase